MSNTLTNVKDIKVAQKALMPFTANLMPVTSFSTNFGPQQADKGDTVRVPLVGAPSGSSDFAGDYTANSDSTVTTIPVTLNRHKFKTVHVTAREAAETAMDVLDTLVETAAQQLAQDVLLDIMTVKVKQDVPLACIKRRGKIAFIPLNASPATEDQFLRYL